MLLLGVLLAPIGAIEKLQFGGFRYWDKIGHLILFGITGFVCAHTASYFKSITARTVYSFTVSVFLALMTEEVQHFVGRDRDFCDFLADISGLLFGILLYVLLQIRHESYRPRD